MAAEDLDELCEEIARRINDEIDAFGGYELRADAGSIGTVYVALREAKHDTDTGEQLADRLTPIARAVLRDSNLDFAISLGAGDDDLLLQLKVRKPG